MQDVAVIESPAAAEASLDPVRSRLLAELAEPGSATTLAARVHLPRQKVNYHLRTLERHGLVELVEERRKGNVTERVMRATAAAYVISPSALALGAARSVPLPGPAVGVLAARARRLDSSATWACCCAVRRRRSDASRRSGSTRTSASARRPTGRPSRKSSRRPSRAWSRGITTRRPSAAATTA